MKSPVTSTCFRARGRLACLLTLLVTSMASLADGQTAVAPPASTAVAKAAASRHPVALRLEALWQKESLPQRAFAGVTVQDPESGETLFTRSGDVLFTPASNTKLFATALALSMLGPEHRMETELRMEGEYFESGGILRGDLALIGKGDPSIGMRIYPYSRENSRKKDTDLLALEAFADAAVARGLRVVEGDIIGDDSAYVWEAFREGWAQDDSLHAYGAPVSALTLNDSTLNLTLRPGTSTNEPASVVMTPASDYFSVINEVRTTAAGAASIRWERVPGQRLLLLQGTMPLKGPARLLRIAVDDPARFAATCLRDALIRKGVVVRGQVRTRHRLPGETADDTAESFVPGPDSLLHLRLSPPMSELITVVNKESQNLHAELLLLEVARDANGFGSRGAAMAQLRRFLAQNGVPQGAVSLADASGLARLNLVSPDATALLLSAMWQGKFRDEWNASLPLGGQDGTLSNRFGNSPLASSIRAKTGTLRGVSALSGYATTRSGKVLAFSAMVNNHGGPGYQARVFLDKIALAIAGAP